MPSPLHIQISSSPPLLFSFFFSFFMGLNSGLCTCKVGAQPFEPHLQPISALVILEIVSHELFAWDGPKP
jgi:hypothetical protein